MVLDDYIKLFIEKKQRQPRKLKAKAKLIFEEDTNVNKVVQRKPTKIKTNAKLALVFDDEEK
jgi:hypothetical protein